MLNSKIFYILIATLYLFSSCHQEPAEQVNYLARSQKLDTVKADIAYDWNVHFVEMVKRYPNFEAPIVARAMAYFNLAFYESLVPGMPHKRSYVGLIQDFKLHSPIVNAQYHWVSAANSAFYEMLKFIFPSPDKEMQSKSKLLFDKYRALALKDWPEQTVKRSEEYGRHIAMEVQKYSISDGGNQAHLMPFEEYNVPSAPSQWQPSTTHRLAMLPAWGRNRTFIKGITSSAEPSPPLAYSRDPRSSFYGSATEIYYKSLTLNDADRRNISFWADTRHQTATAAGQSLVTLIGIAYGKRLPIDEFAEIISKACLAISDAYVVSFYYKYKYRQVSPYFYIRSEINPNWQPSTNMLHCPDYPSAETAQRAAWCTLLASYLGQNTYFIDRSNEGRSDVKLDTKEFHSFTDYITQAANACFLGGNYFRHSIYAGSDLGSTIGSYMSRISLQK